MACRLSLSTGIPGRSFVCFRQACVTVKHVNICHEIRKKGRTGILAHHVFSARASPKFADRQGKACPAGQVKPGSELRTRTRR